MVAKRKGAATPARKKAVRSKGNDGARGAPPKSKIASTRHSAVSSSPRAPNEQRFWLLKTEPSVFSFNDLQNAPKRTTGWNGVRNFQARNFLRDQMQVGDLAFIYHSSTDEAGVYGIAQVVRAGYPDPTAFDAKSEYHDADSTPDSPRWFQVDVQALRPLKRPVLLSELRATPALASMGLLRKGNRLSVQPVLAEEFEAVCKLAER